jgi:hypothetical protein
MAMIAKDDGVSPGCGRFIRGRIVEDGDPMTKGCEHLWGKASQDEVNQAKANFQLLLDKGLASPAGRQY